MDTCKSNAKVKAYGEKVFEGSKKAAPPAKK
jgi:hypothetical protein